MAVYQALGTGPVSFVDTNFNQQELPLNEVFYSSNGWDVTTSPLYAANQPIIDDLMLQLASQGFVVPAGQSLAAQPVAQATVTAAQPGAPGNTITVAFSNVKLDLGTFDVTATATETFPNLTPSLSATGTATTVVQAMGSSVATATGLAFATDGSGLMPAAYSGPLGAVPDAAHPTPGTAFTLAATNSTDATDALLIKVVVTPGTTTFTVTVSWTQKVTGKAFADLLGGTPPLAYLVKFNGPSGPLPNGTVALSGGKNATGTSAAVAASASLYGGF